MNQYFYSQSQNRTVAVRINGIPFLLNIEPDYERIPYTRKLQDLAYRNQIPTYLPQMQDDETTSQRKLFFRQL